jgi:hypothetical protein
MTRERTTGTRKSPTEGGAGNGVAGLAVAWKVAAFLPLVLTGALLAGRIDLGDDSGPAPSANTSVVDTSTPDPYGEGYRERDRTDDAQGDRKKKDKASESPTAEETSAFPVLTPTSADPTPDDPSSPTKSPTRSPSQSPSPSDTPTPEEAREACEEAGVNPLDLDAMADCISDMLDG